ncbi:FK506-binding protein 5-like [Arachis hypogaea]|nr:FK506-binding protein 5-like [Arachis hypogaea]
MHCEACARKVVKALKGFQGVEEVSADSKGSKVVVKGKEADPMKVVERLQKKSGKKVEFISPLPKPQQEEQGKKEEPPKKEEPLQPPQENKDQLLDKAIEKNRLCLMNLDGVIGQVTTQDGVPQMMIMALEIHPTQRFRQLPLMKMDMEWQGGQGIVLLQASKW